MLHQLLSEADGYVVGRHTLEHLETWLLIHLQDILDSKDKQAIRLANSIDADLIQLNEGIIDEETFHDRLQAYVRLAETVSNSIGPGPDSTSSTDARTEQVTAHWEDRPPVVDYRLDYEWVA